MTWYIDLRKAIHTHTHTRIVAWQSARVVGEETRHLHHRPTLDSTVGKRVVSRLGVFRRRRRQIMHQHPSVEDFLSSRQAGSCCCRNVVKLVHIPPDIVGPSFRAKPQAEDSAAPPYVLVRRNSLDRIDFFIPPRNEYSRQEHTSPIQTLS